MSTIQETEVKAGSADAHIQRALKRFQESSDADQTLRASMLEDYKFSAGDQWDAQVRASREADGRPCLTINQIEGPILQITNEQRRARPSVQVNPQDNDGDPETAEVLQGLIRRIESNSDADVAYGTGGDHQVRMGRGWIRVYTEYCDEDGQTAEQDIKIGRVRNPFTIYPDPKSQAFDGSDMRYLFETWTLSLEDYKEKYPTSSLANMADFSSIGDRGAAWCRDDSVMLANYWYVDTVTEWVAWLGDGTKITLETPEDRELAKKAKLVVRRVDRRVIKCETINAVEVLEPHGYLGKYIPFVPVIGTEYDIDGKVDLRGIVRSSKDAQRQSNYWESAITEAVALAPRAPWVMAKGQDEGHEHEWKTANTRNHAVLHYNPKSHGQELVPAPARNIAEAPIQAMAIVAQRSETHIRKTTGFHDVHGEESRPEQSGKAILARQSQGQMGNSHYQENLGRAIRFVGKILIDLVPKYYDTVRVLRILGKDDQQKVVAVTGKTPPEGTALPPGVERIYDLSVGRYDVTVSVGPTYQSMRQQAVESMLGFVQAYPAAFPIIGDLLADNMDWPGAKVIAQRLKKAALKAGLITEEGGPGPNLPPEAAAMLEQLQGQLQQAEQILQQQHQIIETDQIKAQAQYAVEQMKSQTAIEVEQIKAQAALQVAAAEAEATEREAELKLQGEIEKARIQLQASAFEAAQEAEADRQRTGLELAADGQRLQMEQEHDAEQRERDRAVQLHEGAEGRTAAREQTEVKVKAAAKKPAARKSKA